MKTLRSLASVRALSAAALLGVLFTASLAAQTYRLVPTAPLTFTREYGWTPGIDQLARQPDGKILIAGAFNSINGVARPGLARLNADLTFDPTFNPPDFSTTKPAALGTGGLFAIHASKLGGVYVALGYSRLGIDDPQGINRYLVRLDDTGAVDATFGLPNTIYQPGTALAEFSDGTLLLSFQKNDGTAGDRNFLAKVNRYGSLLGEFGPVFEWSGAKIAISPTPWSPPAISALQIENDGTISVAGTFSLIDGAAHAPLARVTAAGKLVPNFPAAGAATTRSWTDVRLLADGRAVLRGYDLVRFVSVGRALVVAADGSARPAPALPFGGPYAVAAGAAERLFYFDKPDSRTVRLRQLTADLTENRSVAVPLVSAAETWTLTNVLPLPGGRILVAGNFETVGGTAQNTIALLEPADVAAITLQPASVSTVAGRTATFGVGIGTSAPATYQWSKDGVPISGANGAELRFAAVQPTDAGAYSCRITIGATQLTSEAAALTVAPNTARLVALSARAMVPGKTQPMIGGVVVEGEAPRRLLVRGIGPGISYLNLAQALRDPELVAYRGSTEIARDRGHALAPAIRELSDQLGAFPVREVIVVGVPTTDSAFAPEFAAGAYTFHLSDANAFNGLGLLEIYDGAPTAPGGLRGLSIRAATGGGASVLIGGVVIAGDGPRHLLVRGLGPKLQTFAVEDPAPDPLLQLFSGINQLAENDDWAANPADIAAIEAATAKLHLAPLLRGSLDSAMIVTLEPGAYTFQLKGKGTLVGQTLLEIYALDD